MHAVASRVRARSSTWTPRSTRGSPFPERGPCRIKSRSWVGAVRRALSQSTLVIHSEEAAPPDSLYAEPVVPFPRHDASAVALRSSALLPEAELFLPLVDSFLAAPLSGVVRRPA